MPRWKTDSLHILKWKPILWSNRAACAYIVHMSRDHNENTPIQIYWKFHHQKTESLKKIWYCHISAQNIDWGGSNEYPQSMLLRRNKKIMYTPVNPIKCYFIKWSLRGVKLEISPPKNWKLKKKIWYCHISAQNIDWGGSNEYPQSMLLRRYKKIMYTPVNPIKCYYIKWSLRGSKLYTL